MSDDRLHRQKNNIDTLNEIVKNRIKEGFTGYLRLDIAQGAIVTIEQSSKLKLESGRK